MTYIRKSRPTSWSQRIELSLKDQLNFSNFVNEERNYYNHILSGISGPIRSMPGTIEKFINHTEELLGEVAVRGIDLRTLNPKELPDFLLKFKDVIFDNNDKFIIDDKMMIIFDLVRKKANIIPHIRRGMVVELMRHAREQISLLKKEANNTSGDTYQYSVIMLSTHDQKTKRHFQLPKAAIKSSVDDKTLTLNIPYFGAAITVQNPPIDWNFIIVRQEEDGRMMVEFMHEPARYQVAYSDHIAPKKKKTYRIGV